MIISNQAMEVLCSFIENCENCGACNAACSLLDDLGSTPNAIAESLKNGGIDTDLVAAIQRCALCGTCDQVCPAGLQPSSLFLVARQILIENGCISPTEYDVMLVDRDWNFFTIYRATHGIRYDDLIVNRYESLFLPGCSLSSYAPKLIRAANIWLQEQGLQTGFSEQCCGKPLTSIGMTSSADSLLAHLQVKLASAGAKEIITACPNCESQLRAAQMPGIRIRSLYDLMVETGIHLIGPSTLTFHDSCPDRYDEKNPRYVRSILSGFPQVEMNSRGSNTICCGSGGIVSAVDSDLCVERAKLRLAEYSASGADICVANCMSCAHRLSRSGEPGQVRHCLELVFGLEIDYAQLERNVHAMWEGEQGEINIKRLEQARINPA